MDILSALRKVTASIKTWADSKLETKLDKNLGTDNAGKVLTIGDDGNIKSQMLDTGIIVLSGTNDNPINIDEIKVSGTYLIKGVVTTSMDTTSGSDSAKLNKTFIDGFARGELMSIYSLQDGFVNQLMMNPTRPLVRLDSGEGYSDAIDASYVQPVEKTTEMTQQVGIRSDGQLFTEPFNQVQSDWNENDETNPAYIKNRTHYDSRERFEISSSGQNVDCSGFIKISDEVMTLDKLEISRIEMSLSVNSINFDNAIFYYGGSFNPSESILGVYYHNEDVRMDLVIRVLSTTQADGSTPGTYLGIDENGTGTYSMKLYREVGELKTLDPKYIKDMYYTDGIEEVTLLDGTFDFVEIDPGLGMYRYFQEKSPFILEEGKTYTVVFDGMSYSCICYYLDGDPTLPAIGNASFWGSTGGNNEPFYIETDSNELYINTKLTDASHTVKITSSEENIKKLDEKYIPDSVYNKIDSAQDTANSAQATANLKMNKNNPVGTGSFSLNRKSGTAVGTGSFVCGLNNTASANYSHAEGDGTKATGYASHAEGGNTKATSSDEGRSTTSSTNKGYYTHAEGYGTVAYGRCSHAEGNGTKAYGNDSHAEGYATKASGSSQHVQGKLNVDDTTGTYAHIIGNGTGDNSLSNAHTVDWSGNAWYAGDVYVGSTSGTNKDAGSKKLATEEYVNSAVSEIPSIPTALPNPYALTFTGAVTGSYDGSQAVTVEIPSGGSGGGGGDIPEALPNPYALTFTGAVTGSYDGSQAVTVEIPSGGGESVFRLINTINISEGVPTITIDKDSNGNAFEISEVLIYFDSTTYATSDGTFYFRPLGQSSYNMACYNFISKTAGGNYQRWIYAKHIANGFWRAEFIMNTGHNVPLYSNPGETITSFQLLGQTLAAGNIYIYGR